MAQDKDSGAQFAHHPPADSAADNARFAHLTGRKDAASRAERGQILQRAMKQGDDAEAARPKSPFGGLYGV